MYFTEHLLSMRVLTFTSLFPNAGEPLLGVFVQQRMAHFAQRKGNNVTVVAPVAYFPSWLPFSRWENKRRIPAYENIRGLEVYHPRYPLIPKVSMLFQGYSMFAASLSVVRRLHGDRAFDCIDAHYVYPDGFAAVLLGKRLGLPVIVSARGTDMNLFPSFRLIRPMIRWTLENAAGTIGVCETLREAMVEMGASENHSTTIGNGIDLARFSPLDRQEARLRLGIPADAEVIVSVGALIPRKGYHFLIPALAKISSKHPNLRLYIIGEGESRSQLATLARANDVQDRVFLMGSKPNEDLRVWYSAADISCLVSSREGWANVLLESLACGTPVVATRVWGAPEVITSPELGVLVEQRVQPIADGLEVALRKQWDRELLIRYAASRTWDVVAKEVEVFLSERIASEKRPTFKTGAVQ
jgi:teichuronic acid biosynthesis glycosyltransferase TuaC